MKAENHISLDETKRKIRFFFLLLVILMKFIKGHGLAIVFSIQILPSFNSASTRSNTEKYADVKKFLVNVEFQR